MRQTTTLPLLFAATTLLATPVGTQAQGQSQDDEPKVVDIDTLNVRDTLYHLSGGGGNGLALIDEINGGVVLIESKRPGWGDAVRQAVEAVTDLPITTIINTHGHRGHAGANAEFPDVTQIVAHENTRRVLARSGLYDGDKADALPDVTFAERFSLLDGLDRIELYHFGPAHTDGDIIVVFPEKGVAYLGDLFPRPAVPSIDRENGGSGLAFPETLARAVASIDGVIRVVTGHGAPPNTYAGRGRRERGPDNAWRGWINWDDFVEYADFTGAFVQAVETAYRAGTRVEDATDTLVLPDRYADYDLTNAQATIEVIYEELAAR